MPHFLSLTSRARAPGLSAGDWLGDKSGAATHWGGCDELARLLCQCVAHSGDVADEGRMVIGAGAVMVSHRRCMVKKIL
jgi:hypothetical protein